MGKAEIGNDVRQGEAFGELDARLLRALDDSLIGTALVNLEGRFRHVNRAYAQITGYTREELLGLTFNDVTHPADREVDAAIVEKLCRGDEASIRREKRYVRKDGSTVFVGLTVSLMRDRDGAPVSRLVQVEDITGRVRADEALRRSESNFRRLFDQASEGIFIADSDGRFVDVNAAGCAMYGYSREELVGRSIADLLPIEESARLAAIRLRSLMGATHEGEWNVLRKDGEIVAVEVRSKFMPDGREVAFVRNIDERKRAERAREESLRWMHAVHEQSPVALVLAHGPNGDRIESNSRAKQMLGSQSDTIVQCRERFSAPDGRTIDFVELPCVRALRGETTAPIECSVSDGNGKTTPALASGAPIIGADGMVLGAVVALQDITPVKELERLRAEWSSVVAHDLRQPIGSIVLNADLLTRSTVDAKLRAVAERIRGAAQRVSRMTDDLMDLSRLDARRLELVRERVDVPALVRASVERVALETPDRRVEIHVTADVPEVDADPDRVTQVMENLLTNAVKYGEGGTPIVVAVVRDAEDVAVSVTNRGKPFAPDDLARLFQRFQRTDSAKLQRIKGSGLGLYITRSLVEAHGGRISVDSPSQGEITFRFTLPAAAA
jgi:PAS domain S-box-containing protein